jgi:hypothetical protein
MTYTLKHTSWVGLNGLGEIRVINTKSFLTPSEALELAAYLVVLAEIAVAGKPADESLPAFEDVLAAVRNT